jgi:hypothetical protein
MEELGGYCRENNHQIIEIILKSLLMPAKLLLLLNMQGAN